MARIWKLVKMLWSLFVLYVFIGGCLAFAGGHLGFVGPYCEIASEASGIYPICQPCGLHFSIFGVIEITPCGNPVLEFLLTVGVVIPQLIIAILLLLIGPLVTALAIVSKYLPSIVLLLPLYFYIGRAIYFDLLKRENIWRGLHRIGLLGCCLLTVIYGHFTF